ncbi:MAG: DUF2934 domain-containing protein [Bryobacterales bacterium]|jgi:hypothetical protein|nr:DUF2934 domain-containing protein [Bryobacterales bacterium]
MPARDKAHQDGRAGSREPVTAAARNRAAVGEGIASSDGHVPEPGRIARLAYSYWEARGGQGGSAEEDWLRAEQELRTL